MRWDLELFYLPLVKYLFYEFDNNLLAFDRYKTQNKAPVHRRQVEICIL
jgi:hypothetical protein